MSVPYTFGAATTAIPLSQLDSNFATTITLGNTAIQLGNTVTTLNNMTLANVTISSGNVTITNVSVTTANVGTVNATTVIATTGNITTVNATTVVATTANATTTNVTTSNVTNETVSGSLTLSGGTANGVLYLNGSKVATSGSALTYNGTTLTAVNNSSANSITLSRTSAVARDWSLGIDGDGGFRLTDQTGGILILSSLPSGVTFLASASELAFKYNSSTEGMRLTSTGLGIGTSSPSNKLSISGRMDFTAYSTHMDTWGMWANSTDGTTISAYTGYPITFRIANAQKMQLDISGNLGLGVTPSGSYKLQVSGGAYFSSGLNISDTSVATFGAWTRIQENGFYDAGGNFTHNTIKTSGANDTWNYVFSAPAARYKQLNGAHTWYTAPSGTAGTAISFTQAMTLDGSGNLLVGTTSASSGSRLRVFSATNDGSEYNILNQNSSSTILFAVDTAGGMNVGVATNSPYNLTTAGSANAVLESSGAFKRSTSSIRYKTDVQNATHGLAEVMQLRPVTYKGNNDGEKVFGGLIAEEVDEAGLTEFVAYNDEGQPDALHYGNMVALAFKAIQEQQEIINQLKADVAALKGA